MTGPMGSSAARTDFDGGRLAVARRLRRLTKAALAKKVGVTATAIAQFEKGHARPSPAVAASLSLQLGLPREFFGAGGRLTSLPAAEAHFRSLRSTRAASREQALAFGELSLELVDLVSTYVELPPVNLPPLDLPEELDETDIVTAARATRTAWGTGPGPLPSVVQLLEANGVIVLRLPDTTDRAVNAFSTDSGDRPLVFLAQGRDDKARSRFDAAHETGHLVLHPDTEPGSKIVENQANTFASELLMPREEIIDSLPKRIDWPAFHALKQHWGVSLRALVYRAHNLGVLSEASYRRANQQLSIWGLPEPGSLGLAESPQLLTLARQVMVENGIDFDNVMAAGRISDEVKELVIRVATEEMPRVHLGP